MRTVEAQQVTVVCGATGSGKTTQLPQMLLRAGRGRGGKLIGHTQPRRLAARSVAARIAEEMGERIDAPGCVVGSKVRFADTTSRSTRIKLMTDGILLAEIQGEPMLDRYDTIIIDEAHERSLNIDFLLGYLKRTLDRRLDLKVVITSATIDPDRFAMLFSGVSDPAAARTRVPVIEVSGRTYPIQTRYRPVEADRNGEIDARDIDQAIVDAVRELERPGPGFDVGDVLVFLPGEREIRSAEGALRRATQGSLEVLPLFAKLSAAQQDRIFHPTPGQRRVILATNVAETSLTVPGIRHVVDVGVARLNRYDYRTKITRLHVEPISQASANQRAGRCGRVAPGVAIRLYSEADFAARPAHTDPEIKRISLASAILRCMSLNLGPIEAFPFIDPPEAKAIAEARATLFELGAVESEAADATLTETGAALARLPIDPRPARMLLQAAKEGCLDEALVLVSAMGVQDPRERPGIQGGVAQAAHQAFSNPESDYLTLLNYWDAIEARTAPSGGGRRRGGGGDEDDGGDGDEDRPSLFGFCREAFLSYNRVREWLATHRQLADLAEEMGLREISTRAEVGASQTPGVEGAATLKPNDRLHRAIMAGSMSGVLCRDDAASSGHNVVYRGIRGLFASIHPGSVLFKKNPKWILSGEIVATSKIYARNCCTVKPEWLAELGAHLLDRAPSDEHFDEATGEAMAWVRETFAGVPIRPRALVKLETFSPARARELFIAEGLAGGRLRVGANGGADDHFAWLRHNSGLLAEAMEAEAKLRQRGVLVPLAERIAWFERRLPGHVTGRRTLELWLAEEPRRGETLRLSAADVLLPAAQRAGDATLFPGAWVLRATQAGGGQTVTAPLKYTLAPGKDEDGVTLTIPLLALTEVTAERAAWLVPGMLPAKVASILKQLPKDFRVRLEAKATPPGDLDALAADVAGVLSPPPVDALATSVTPLAVAVCEAIEVLTGIAVKPEQLPMGNLPAHLQLRLVVHDDAGKVLGDDRDIPELQTKLRPRLSRALAAISQAKYRQTGLVAWSFGTLESEIEPDEAGSPLRFPTLIDAGDSVMLMLADSRSAADIQTRTGIRRLFALAMHGEMPHHIAALGQWSEMCAHYKPFGGAAELADALTLVVAERIFMQGQPAVRDQETFEERKSAHWGRLATAVQDVAALIARTLDARAKVAHRLSGGTNRNWVQSITDLREHMAYLMPPGFLTAVTPERLEHYPKYAEAARQRLLNLREDGTAAESAFLPVIVPRFKKFTGYVAKRHGELLRAEQAGGSGGGQGGAGGDGRSLPMAGTSAGGKASAGAKAAVLPASRRHTVRINADAATWAITPGALGAGMERYRWLLEELRVCSFAPELTRLKVTAADVDKAWVGE